MVVREVSGRIGWNRNGQLNRKLIGKKLKFGIDGEKRRHKEGIALGVCPYF